MKPFHLPLPEPLHAQLMQAAQSTGWTATQLACDAHISRNAGTAFDLEIEVEAAGVAHLLT